MEEYKKTTVHFEEFNYNYDQDSEEEYEETDLCENIITLFYDLKSRFPYFLGTRAERLYKFILSKNPKTKINAVPKHFIEENLNEIDVTFGVVTKFLSNYKMYIKEMEWIRFCYAESLAT
jgi:hypothetical protein